MKEQLDGRVKTFYGYRLMAISNEPCEVLYADELLTYLQTICKSLLVSYQLQIW
jgi:hypothetical protein